jgi:hypothetical protein
MLVPWLSPDGNWQGAKDTDLRRSAQDRHSLTLHPLSTIQRELPRMKCTPVYISWPGRVNTLSASNS